MGELVERVDGRDNVVAVVERAEAIRRGWPHRVATVVCRDADGRILLHRRPEGVSRFPGRLNWMVGGAVEVGETYEAGAARELTEEFVPDAREALVHYLERRNACVTQRAAGTIREGSSPPGSPPP
ncbi:MULTISPECIES: NUDIX domain-containing protein [unclassified Streptomyces]|uniref:NUDIX domain-containing protein n=1 Tax=unclassified Streptomyces TaxID=2593676 RepID=UPI0022594450|nr:MULTISPECIES: NUDIX domain-containing protein [unclassified Streptomyces]MCX4529684.1 NUDIX domain-containing protein [Streptomyces sp. NBC_01551]MCX4539745.1 NUDIX domain-containing protein [Streptomyces sp. NBC_01565]